MTLLNSAGGVVKSACAQKLNRLPDGFAILHDERMGRVDDNVVAHAREPGPFHRNLSVVAVGNEHAVDPVDGTVAGGDADGKSCRAELVRRGICACAQFTSRRAVEPFEKKQPDRKSTRLNSSHLGISYAV